jgi:hypothetical protein
MMSKEKIVEVFHNHLDDKGYNNVRSTAPGKVKPTQFELRSKNITLKPDVSAEIRGKRVVFEFVEALPAHKQLVIEKCRNYLSISKAEGIRPRLIVPVDRYDAVLQWINANRLEQMGLIRVNLKSAANA